MNGSFVARLLFAVTVMVVALLLAPTASFAHAGHDHGATAIEASKQGPATHAVIEDVAEQSSESAIAKSQSVISSLPGTTGKSKIVCMGGCCTAASASCCAISLPILLGLLEPPYDREVFATVQSKGTGIVPGALAEPPKFLV